MKRSAVLALMLVLSLSIVVVAAEHDLPNQPLGGNAFSAFPNGNPNTTIDTTINILPYLYVAKWDVTPMVFDLDSPAAMGNAYNIIRDFEFATNTPVRVTLTENFTGTFPATDALHTAILLQKSGHSSSYEVTGHPGQQYAQAIYTFAPGKHSGELNVGIGWYNTGKTKQTSDSWDDLEWWDVLAGEYSGQITITVEDIND